LPKPGLGEPAEAVGETRSLRSQPLYGYPATRGSCDLRAGMYPSLDVPSCPTTGERCDASCLREEGASKSDVNGFSLNADDLPSDKGLVLRFLQIPGTAPGCATQGIKTSIPTKRLASNPPPLATKGL
jgi:hypothetical protein